jgi:hypothetical protein
VTAPRRTRSLLRRPFQGPWGRRTAPHGPGRACVRCHTPRSRPHARLQAPRGGLAVEMAKALAVCGIGAAVLWPGAAPALADTTPPATTTTSDAPPPDPYTPPVRSVKPRPAARARTYTPPAAIAPRSSIAPRPSIAPRAAVRTSRPQPKAKAVRHQRKQPVRPPTKAPPVSTWLAPLPRVVAASVIPFPTTNERDHPYLWLAGIAFAVLAVAGLTLHTLSMRYFDLEVRLR